MITTKVKLPIKRTNSNLISLNLQRSQMMNCGFKVRNRRTLAGRMERAAFKYFM